MKICVVIPIYNECEAIGMVIDSIQRKGLDVIAVNDGSTDASGNIAREHGATVLSNDTKSGKGSALRRGFRQALDQGYDGVVVMDGDGQHDAEDLERIVHVAEAHPVSIVAGSRMSNAKGMPMLRRVTNMVMSWAISCVCRQKITDTQCGYRYISGEILKKISLECTNYEIETEVLIKSCRAGYPVYSVPVRTIYSNEKSKIRPWRDTVRFFTYFLKELFRT